MKGIYKITLVLLALYGFSYDPPPTIVHVCVETKIIETIDTTALINAFIWVESRGNDSIIGTKNDVGCLQITPPYVKDANRILGKEKYNLNDRYDRNKSIEMFMVVQGKYNPEFDLHLACKVQNPLAPISYHKMVEDRYKEEINIKKQKTNKMAKEIMTVDELSKVDKIFAILLNDVKFPGVERSRVIVQIKKDEFLKDLINRDIKSVYVDNKIHNVIYLELFEI